MSFERMKKFQDYLVGWRIPGNDCSIYYKGSEVYRYTAGYADVESGRRMRGDELYFFWSASKVATTSLALRLLEDGLYSMTDPVYEYIPEFKDMTVKRRIDGKEELVPVKNPIKVYQLFNMTAGFDYDFNKPQINELLKNSDGNCSTLEVVKRLAQAPLSFEPGERWSYSLCHDALGGFIEALTGRRLNDYAQEVLFKPLGMKDTCYNMPAEDKLERLATQYRFDDAAQRYAPAGNECSHFLSRRYDSGGAGIVSTCEDYIKFASCIANGGVSSDGYRYLSRRTIELWRTNTLTDEQLSRDFNWSHYIGYGYGYGVRTMLHPERAGALSPRGEFGWGGAAGTYVIIDPDNDAALVYTQHMLNNQEPFISQRLRNIMYAEL